MKIEKNHPSQAEETAALIKRNLQEVNARYYSSDYINRLVSDLSADGLIEKAKKQRVYVVIDEGKIIGTGTLSDYGTEDEPSYYGTAIFVAVDVHRNGVGRTIMEKIEEKATKLGAKKIIVRAARNARGFYEKLGYHYLNAAVVEDHKGNYIMEKPLA